jgi:hypothetical protein
VELFQPALTKLKTPGFGAGGMLHSRVAVGIARLTEAPPFGILPKISTTVEITVEKPNRHEGGARMVVSFPAISQGQTPASGGRYDSVTTRFRLIFFEKLARPPLFPPLS